MTQAVVGIILPLAVAGSAMGVHPLGSDSSGFPFAVLAITSIMTVALAFAWRQRLVSGSENLERTRVVFGIVGLWAASISAVGQIVFSIFRLFYPPHSGYHQWQLLPIALLGLPISLVGILGVFATGAQRRIVVISSGVMAIVWFFAALDNVNW